MGAVDRDVPPSVRWIRAAAGWLRAQPTKALLAALAAAACLSVANAVFVVGNGETGARQRFGRLPPARIPAGLGVGLPWGIDRVTRVRTGEVLREEIAGDATSQLTLVTGDENLIEVAVVVQYTVADLGAFLFAADDPRVLLAQSVRSALMETIGAMPVDDVLTSGKAAVQQAARQRVQVALDAYFAGIAVLGINLQSVSPPPEAARAFRAVSDAKSDAAKMVNDANSERERALNLSRGEASTIVEAARAGAATRVQLARGASDRFAALLAQRRQSPAQAELDLALASARRVLPRAKLVILAPGEPPRIDFNRMEPPAR
jgi:membrane protease subunit HflK